MCGILGLASGWGTTPPVYLARVAAMRDLMAHRGPDGCGLWHVGHEARERAASAKPNKPVRPLTPGQVILAHRRLAVIDPSPAGAQPMVDPHGRGVLTYNGELYNDAELRAELRQHGWTFCSSSDTETVLAALIEWGAGALSRLRGMYALGFCDLARSRLLIARDPLGVKPLYYWRQESTRARPAQLAFASEIPPLLAHPHIASRPDLATVHAYATTIRTTLAERTLFESIHTLLPGETLDFDLTSPDLPATRYDHSTRVSPREMDLADATARTRFTVEDSVARHLRSDVPMCSLLSGGLDSSIIAAIARRHAPSLNTFCSGGRLDDAPATKPHALDDFTAAAAVAAHLGTHHEEAPLTRARFSRRWAEMVAATGLPLSTPNEVAINEVARALRARGHVVALSGEGADELFAGYSIPLAHAHDFLAKGGGDPAPMFIEHAAWIPPSTHHAILAEGAFASDANEHLLTAYRDEFTRLQSTSGPNPLEPFLRLLRRINLDGLLRRLDSATMLESVEGRTPFADSLVADFAQSLPMHAKFRFDADGRHGTKLALRHAFAPDLPPEIVSREKASFPLPFQGWMGDHAALLRSSDLARTLFSEAVIATVAAQPQATWRFAWPMINLALWGERWWGNSSGGSNHTLSNTARDAAQTEHESIAG